MCYTLICSSRSYLILSWSCLISSDLIWYCQISENGSPRQGRLHTQKRALKSQIPENASPRQGRLHTSKRALTKFPKLASANGVLTLLVKGPWILSWNVRGCRGAYIVVNIGTNTAVPQNPLVKLKFKRNFGIPLRREWRNMRSDLHLPPRCLLSLSRPNGSQDVSSMIPPGCSWLLLAAPANLHKWPLSISFLKYRTFAIQK